MSDKSFWRLNKGLVGLLLFLVVLKGPEYYKSFSDGLMAVPFESATWKQSLAEYGKNSNRTRARMIKDLLNNQSLIGLSREEIETKLGKTVGLYLPECPEPRCSLYPLSNKGLGNVFPALIIRFDSNGRVDKVE